MSRRHALRRAFSLANGAPLPELTWQGRGKAGKGWQLQVPTAGRRYQVVKRSFDVLASVALLPVIVPMLLVIGAAVGMSSGFPVFYSQARLGRRGTQFPIYKFRTMSKDADRVLAACLERSHEARLEWQQTHKLKNDPRVTRLGRFLRKTSLDELPQIFNVLRGEMSLVGPRPISHAERIKYADRFAYYSNAVPGVTGLWQVSGRSNLSYAERVRLDEQYVRHWTFGRDLKILWRTPRSIVRRDGAY